LLLYYITDRKQLPGGEAEQQRRVIAKIAEAARAGVDLIQLREKDLPGRALEQLARAALKAIRENSASTKLLINSRVDIAIGVGADGVHLTSADVAASEVRAVVSRASFDGGRRGEFVIASSTHSIRDVEAAYAHGADFVVFGPVFAKVSAPAREGVGVRMLHEACESAKRGSNAVFALGGVTAENARACVEAGASGIAAIRLFQEGELGEAVAALRRGEGGSAKSR
jgi:thiamine-phosphate pyrophosphorylase